MTVMSNDHPVVTTQHYYVVIISSDRSTVSGIKGSMSHHLHHRACIKDPCLSSVRATMGTLAPRCSSEDPSDL